jgi:xanthine dehydrogenase large subunit
MSRAWSPTRAWPTAASPPCPQPAPARPRNSWSAKPGMQTTVEQAQEILANEFTPIDDVRSGAEFRRQLIPSLFEKFWLGEEAPAQDAPLDFCAWVGSQRRGVRQPRAQARKRHRPRHRHGPIRGRSGTPSRDAGNLARSVHSGPRPVDQTGHLGRRENARHRRVLTGQDVPGDQRHRRPAKKDEAAAWPTAWFAIPRPGDRRWSGAASRNARRPPAPWWRSTSRWPSDPQCPRSDRGRQNSFHTDPHVIRRGDSRGRPASQHPRILKGDFDLGGQEHFYLEAQAAWAEPGDDGDMFVCSSTQHPSEVQAVISHVLHLPRNKVVVEAPRMGGGFGGKETQGNGWAAWWPWPPGTGRPVRVCNSIATSTCRSPANAIPSTAKYEVGFDDEGRILGGQGRAHLRRRLGARSVENRSTTAPSSTSTTPTTSRPSRFLGRVGKTNNVLPHRVTAASAAPGHGGHRGDDGPRRPPSGTAARAGARAQPLPAQAPLQHHSLRPTAGRQPHPAHVVRR